MYSLITGGMRSGKSYLMAKRVLKAIDEGRPVVTDLQLNVIDCPHLYKWEWSALTEEFQTEEERFKRYPYLGMGGVYYALDEGWKGLKSGDRTISNNIQLMSFFREHAQFLDENGISNDIDLIVQNFKGLNAQIRELADVTILCLKPKAVGMKNMSINYYVDGAWSSLRPPKGSNKDLILKTDRIFLSPEIYKCYNSHAKTQAKDGINKGGFDKEGINSSGQTVFHSWKFRGLVLFIFAMGYFFYSSVVHMSRADSAFNKSPMAAVNNNKVQTNEKVSKVASNNLSSVNNASGDSGDRAKGMDRSPDRTKDVSGLGKDTNIELASRPSPDSDKGISPSTNWRLGTVINNKRTHEWFIYIVSTQGDIKRINADNCTHDEYANYECIIDNELITKSTGSKPSTGIISVPSLLSSK